jgi:hypothetical protein
MEDEYVQGDSKAKAKFFGLLTLLVFSYIYLEFFYEISPPSVQNKQELNDYLYQQLLVWIVYAAIFCFLIYRVVRLALSTKQSGRWPPPNFGVPFKTKIRRGQYVKSAWISLLAGAVIMAVDLLLRLYILYRLSQLSEMLQ